MGHKFSSIRHIVWNKDEMIHTLVRIDLEVITDGYGLVNTSLGVDIG